MSEGEASVKYKPHVVLVTGGAGFIASCVVETFVMKYPDVRWIAYDCLTYCSSKNNLKKVLDRDNFCFVQGDICDPEQLRTVFSEHSIDTVMHFAAETHVDRSLVEPLAFIRTNVIGTQLLIDVAGKAGVSRFIHVSTDEVYGPTVEPVSESAALLPTNPYAATKASAEHIARAGALRHNMDVIITRSSNIYGPKQFVDKVIPRFILQLMHNLPCTVHGPGTVERSFLYIDDLVDAFDIILHSGRPNTAYNIASEEKVGIRQLAEMLVDTLKDGGQMPKAELYSSYIKHTDDRKVNDESYTMKNDLINGLGWQAKIRFAEGIRRTIIWMKSVFQEDGSGDFDTQLHRYWPSAPSLQSVLEPHPAVLE